MNPMKISDEFFNYPESYEVFEAEYVDYHFRIVFSQWVGFFCDVLNAEERYNIVKKEFENDMELRDFEPVLILHYVPIFFPYEEMEKGISLYLGFRNKDGNEYADYTELFDCEDVTLLDINFDDDAKEDLCKLANLLFLRKTGMTCYETMLEDEDFDLLEEDIYDVRKLKRMSRQALTDLNSIKVEEKLSEIKDIYNEL